MGIWQTARCCDRDCLEPNGDEQGRRRHGYEWMHVPYYVVFDPIRQLSAEQLQIYELQRMTYIPHNDAWLSEVGLGLTLWSGTYEDREDQWLRWCYQDGTLVPTGSERAARAEARAERLAAQLRALGIEPEES